MSDWREGATAIRAAIERRKAEETAASARRKEPDGLFPQQTAFAHRIIEEVLTPVLREFVRIVTGEPGKPIVHEYDKRTLGLTCDLDSLRYSVRVYLLPDSVVRIAVFLNPSCGDGCHRDYGIPTPDEAIERWFGESLVRLYEYRW
jgi:hypothetical protein